MADAKWIKIVTDIFDNRKIKQIETFPQGDSLVIIWVKLLCLAGKINDNGLIYLTEKVAYTEEMLAAELGRPINLIRIALRTFEQFRMIEIVDGVIVICNWEKYQNANSLERMREKGRIRTARCRAKQKALIEEKKAANNGVTLQVTQPVTLQVTQPVTLPVTRCNAIEKDIDIDIDNKRENKERKENVTLPSRDRLVSPDEKEELFDEAVEIATNGAVEYLSGKIHKKLDITDGVKRYVRARLKEGLTLEDLKTVVDKKVKQWMGTKMQPQLNPRTLFGPNCKDYLQELEVPERSSQPKNQFNQMIQHGYDFDQIERENIASQKQAYGG